MILFHALRFSAFLLTIAGLTIVTKNCCFDVVQNSTLFQNFQPILGRVEIYSTQEEKVRISLAHGEEQRNESKLKISYTYRNNYESFLPCDPYQAWFLPLHDGMDY